MYRTPPGPAPPSGVRSATLGIEYISGKGLFLPAVAHYGTPPKTVLICIMKQVATHFGASGHRRALVLEKRFEMTVSDHVLVKGSKREARLKRYKLMVPEMILLFFCTSFSYCSVSHLPIEVN
jgi:hypothetical protein